MTSVTASVWNWEWPSTGPIPTRHGLDSEMFDGTDFPYTSTFVREAIQNSLDARLDQGEPTIISFHFHSGKIGPRRAFLQHAMEHREKAQLDIPDDWSKEKIGWLVVEDFNTKGLSGSLDERSSDFWGYWLNFGETNKKGTGRGSHGIGRVTFLIASRVQSVIGYTRRVEDGKVAVCGMAVLRAKTIRGRHKSTHAYLARDVCDDIYKLHKSPDFISQVRAAFSFSGYDHDYSSGFGLAIPYHHKEMNADRILAAAIEHFSPAIIGNDLVVRVDGRTLDRNSIDEIASDDTIFSPNSAVGKNSSNYLKLVREAQNPQKTPFVIRLPISKSSCLREWGAKNSKFIEKLRDAIDVSSVALDIVFPMTRKGKTVEVTLRSIIGRCPPERKPIDLLFRRGMCLPLVNEKNPMEFDIATFVSGESHLATYLNFCEGKAHLDLLESKEIQQKLRDNGLWDGYDIRRLAKFLSKSLRELLLPEVSKPNQRVFERYFAKPMKKRKGEGGDNPRPSPDITSAPEFDVGILKKNNGIRIKTNPDVANWPINATITLAYDNGSSRPTWNPYDFTLDNMDITATGCELQISENTMKATMCSIDTNIRIYGFDPNRELIVTIRVEETGDA